MQFTKLFSSILDSTIWQEPAETRLVWITMLAMSDRQGDIHASIPGLAKRSGVSILECEKALDCLLSPDPYSRTKDNDGKRISEIDGGWTLLNHGKYRALLSAEERKEYNRKKQAEYRAKKKGNVSKNVNDMSITVNHSEHNAHSTEADYRVQRADPKISKAEASSCPLPDEKEKETLLALWENSPKWSRQRSSKKMVVNEWNKIKRSERPTEDELIKAIKAWSNCSEWKRDGGQYAQGLHLWVKAQRWDSLPDEDNLLDHKRNQSQDRRAV
jgi:hypothetical protein